ncbi:MAG: hypothetical protein PVH56_01710 [Desulfobacterales bacterium]|jgi:hypothetical protein
MRKIENLKKITLTFEAGTTADIMDLLPQYPKFEFIFGLAPEGMTPFEYEIVDRTEGEEILLHINKEEYYRFFEHLNPPIMDLFDGREAVHLKVKIASIANADSREIVKAMAEMAHRSEGSCAAGDCDCGCGCG